MELAEKKRLLETTRRERGILSKRMNELLTLRLDGEITKETFSEQHGPMEKQVQQLDEQLPELEAEIDVRTVQLLSSDAILTEVQHLHYNWADMTFAQKRGIVETITTSIVVGREDITINLAYAPTLSPNPKNAPRNSMVALNFLPYRKTVSVPPSRLLPLFPQTLGDRIRTKRVESLQLQSQVARLIGVSEDTITNWETNRFVPQINLYPAIFHYLGHYPFNHETESIGGKVKQLRNCLGLSYEAAGEVFAVYATTVRGWELNRNRPTARKRALILARFNSLPDFLKHKTTQYESTEKNHTTVIDVL